jgi:hypothetical protein
MHRQAASTWPRRNCTRASETTHRPSSAIVLLSLPVSAAASVTQRHRFVDPPAVERQLARASASGPARNTSLTATRPRRRGLEHLERFSFNPAR